MSPNAAVEAPPSKHALPRSPAATDWKILSDPTPRLTAQKTQAYVMSRVPATNPPASTYQYGERARAGGEMGVEPAIRLASPSRRHCRHTPPATALLSVADRPSAVPGGDTS